MIMKIHKTECCHYLPCLDWRWVWGHKNWKCKGLHAMKIENHHQWMSQSCITGAGTTSAFLMTLFAEAPSAKKIFKLNTAPSVRGLLPIAHLTHLTADNFQLIDLDEILYSIHTWESVGFGNLSGASLKDILGLYAGNCWEPLRGWHFLGINVLRSIGKPNKIHQNRNRNRNPTKALTQPQHSPNAT